MAGYNKSIEAAREFAAKKLEESSTALNSLDKLKEQKSRTDAEISETLRQLRARKEALDKAIAELELIQE